MLDGPPARKEVGPPDVAVGNNRFEFAIDTLLYVLTSGGFLGTWEVPC